MNLALARTSAAPGWLRSPRVCWLAALAAGCSGAAPAANAPEPARARPGFLWPKNWGWLADDDQPGTIERTLTRAAHYVDQHRSLAEALGKPLVLEEFGLPRDGAALEPGSPTSYRERFYASLFEQIEQSAGAGGPLRGSNVWTWGRAGRAQHSDGQWRDGDRSFTGDPPQEPQGLNSIFDRDATTLELLRTHARALERALGKPTSLKTAQPVKPPASPWAGTATGSP